MKVTQHILISAAIAGSLYGLTRSATAALACFAAGVLLDLDHLFDYMLNYGAPIRIGHFFRAFRYEALRHIVVFLHAWEWMLIAAAVLWLLGWEPVVAGVVLGASVHLALDQLFNNHRWPAYFLSYRLFHCFSPIRFYGEREYGKRINGVEAGCKHGKP